MSVSFPRIDKVPFAPSSNNAVPATSSLAVGGQVSIVTIVVVEDAGQLPEARIVYVTVYVPGVDVLGSISPVLALIVNPAVDE